MCQLQILSLHLCIFEGQEIYAQYVKNPLKRDFLPIEDKAPDGDASQ